MSILNLKLPNGQICGVVEDGVFRRKINGSKHFLKHPPAIATNLSVLAQVQESGAKSVSVFDKESKVEYRAPLGLFYRRGFVIDRGFGAQRALPLKFWTQHGANIPEQLSMFDV